MQTFNVCAEHGSISSISFSSRAQGSGKLSRRVLQELNEYCAGTRKSFDLPLKSAGTPFQENVWRALRKIPYGETCTYGDVASAIGKPKAIRAVASAIAKNPHAIVVPCHRVLPKAGGVGTYAWGNARKRELLALELGVRS